MTYGVVFPASGAAGWILTKASIRLAKRWGAVDLPADYKVHRRAIPRLGGIGIVLGTASSMAAAVSLGIRFDAQMLIFAAGGLATAGLGLLDDVRGLKATRKLVGQVVVAVGVALGIAVTGGPGGLGLTGAIVTAALIIGLSNAVNLIDGMDGLPLLDTMLSVAKRIYARRPLFDPDRSHSYNLLADRLRPGYPMTVLVVCLAGACFAALGVLVFTATGLQAGISLGLLCGLLGLAIRRLKLFRMEGYV